mgnify:CR=1 FL=1
MFLASLKPLTTERDKEYRKSFVRQLNHNLMLERATLKSKMTPAQMASGESLSVWSQQNFGGRLHYETPQEDEDEDEEEEEATLQATSRLPCVVSQPNTPGATLHVYLDKDDQEQQQQQQPRALFIQDERPKKSLKKQQKTKKQASVDDDDWVGDMGAPKAQRAPKKKRARKGRKTRHHHHDSL